MPLDSAGPGQLSGSVKYHLQANQRVEFTVGSGVTGPQAEGVHAI